MKIILLIVLVVFIVWVMIISTYVVIKISKSISEDEKRNKDNWKDKYLE
ncbi:MAG: hypothetical protein SPD90_04325 [Intestinibacter sp.]|nr:hypothetical protein [Intestinibacter sp.]MDY4574264.1 hypothetical protein [Intestinibacter sp.]